MRDLLLALIIFGSLPAILVRPWFGIIMWSWVSFMNPHRAAWGFMYDMNVAMLIAVATLAGWALTRDDRRIPVNAITVFMLLLVLWTGVTSIFVLNPEDGIPQWTQFVKIILMTFVLLSLIKEQHFKYLVWVTVVSIGYFGFKGGIFTLVTGGQFRVWGPPETFIEDNNALALALLMVIPLIVYLGHTIEQRWIRLGMYAAAVICLVSVVGSYSRGGFLGLAAITVLLWTRSRRKLVLGAAAVLCIAVAVSVIPHKWFDRMETIENYQGDASAMGRLEMWGHAIRIANERPIVGGGFGVFEHPPTYAQLSPEIVVQRNVHSIYFEMLGTQGYVGLALFLMLGAAGMLTARRIRLLTRDRKGLENEYRFASLIQISLVAYAVAGTFQNLSTYDLYYTLLAMIALQYTFVREKLKHGAPADSPSTQPAEAPARALPANMPKPSFLRTTTR